MFSQQRESKQQTLMSWTYPTITDDLKTYISSRCFSISTWHDGLFFYLKRNSFWIYIKQFINKSNPGALIVIAVDLEPAKYKVLCDILVNKYTKNYNPVDLVKLYLNLITSGSVCYQENGTEISLNLRNYKKRNKN
ncbi:hypothetical protein NQ314_014659 [Rhamnusium bicolor]|uniref:Uncharacterized protein n=1 Tax=Rhamnusium bicolor TaxID=1586634 RepID=A0AAV8X1M7_9CUCU|nr:hypothetical protein NQ314_014659 [Rhamnusium bicolor]